MAMPPTGTIVTPDWAAPRAGERPPVSIADYLRRWAGSYPDRVALTFLDFQADPDGAPADLTFAELDRRVDDLARRLRGRAGRGDRAAILTPQGPDYVVSFLACLRAGVVAVPLFAPDLVGHGDRVAGVLSGCAAAVALVTGSTEGPVTDFLAARDLAAATTVLAVDRPVPGAPGLNDSGPNDSGPNDPGQVDPEPGDIEPDDLAYLQYTSGSTRAPAGVMISHRNVLANSMQAFSAYDAIFAGSTTVSWLPLFHDLGLVLGITAPVLGACRSVLMDPLAFIERPVRWLRALSDHPNAISAGPNFAFSYAAAKITPAERLWLQLDDVLTLVNGAEPIRPETIDTFLTTFAECGLPATCYRNGYGLAEATVMVALTDSGRLPTRISFDRDKLAGGTAVPAGPDAEAVTLVAAGRPIEQDAIIVDPQTCRPLPDGAVGEIWVAGPNVGTGYWNDPDATEATFGARLAPADGSATDGAAGAGPRWLRTGDLGVRCDGELFITGRIKDLIIVDGRNHYPQDIEATVEGAHPAIRPHAVAAFAVPGADGVGEALVVVAERARVVAAGELDHADVTRTVRAAVSVGHAVALHELVVTEPWEVPRTSSGKISRTAARQAYLAGAYPAGRGAAGGAG